MFPGSLYPAQYSLDTLSAVAPSHISCWALVGATDHVWGASSALVANAWADLTPNTYPSYCIGEAFTLVANEQFPMIAVEDRPLYVPPDSGFTGSP